MNIRYALQVLQIESKTPLTEQQIVFMALSDFIPILFLIACIHIGHKGEWDCLLSNYLRPSKEKDTSTDAGSHMLSVLKQDLQFDSLMGSTAFPDKYVYCECPADIDIQIDALEVSVQRRSKSDAT